MTIRGPLVHDALMAIRGLIVHWAKARIRGFKVGLGDSYNPSWDKGCTKRLTIQVGPYCTCQLVV